MADLISLNILLKRVMFYILIKKKILLQVCFPHHLLQTWAQPFRDE